MPHPIQDVIDDFDKAIFGGQPVHCGTCRAPAAEVSIENLTEEVEEGGFAVQRHTGEKIATITCHGQTWHISNKQGLLK